MNDSLPQAKTAPLWLTTGLPIACIVATAAYFYWFIGQQAINVPYQDDITDFMIFLVDGSQASSFGEFFSHWNRSFNEHKTNATRLAVYVIYLLQGEVNFKTLALAANVSLPLIVGIWALTLEKSRSFWLMIAAVTFLLLNLRTFPIVIWGQPTFAYYFVVMYAFAALYLLHRATYPRLAIAAICCVLASWTLATGLIAWFAGFVLLAHHCFFHDRKRWRYAAIWLVLSVSVVFVWLQNDTRVELMMADDPVVAALAKLVLKDALVDPTALEWLSRHIAFVLVTLGAAFVVENTVIAGIIGAVMLTWLIYCSWIHRESEDLRLLAYAWFIFSAAAAITYGRASIVGPAYSLDSRYSLISILFACCLLLLTLNHVHRYRLRLSAACFALSGLFCLWTYSQFTGPLQEHRVKRVDFFNDGKYMAIGIPPKESNGLIAEAIALGIYNPPERPLQRYIPTRE